MLLVSPAAKDLLELGRDGKKSLLASILHVPYSVKWNKGEELPGYKLRNPNPLIPEM